MQKNDQLTQNVGLQQLGHTLVILFVFIHFILYSLGCRASSDSSHILV